MKIFIANLPYKIDEQELKKILTQYGQVASIKIIIDKETGKRKGFGFAEMPVREQAQSAIAALHDNEVHGRKIALSEAVEKEQDRRPAFQLPRREFKNSENSGEIDGNKW